MAARTPAARRAPRRSPSSAPRRAAPRTRAAEPRRRGVVGAVRAAPRPLQILVGLVALLLTWVVVNWSYQVARKPSELLFPVSDALYKTPTETWRAYGGLFRAHSTALMRPELLAALAQVEASGNPVARTYWRFSLALHPFEIYRPASSAVGMYQITDGTFAEARRYCIRDHRVIEDGPWNDFDSCWFNNFYTRILPSHAVELTAAYLDRRVGAALARHGRSAVPLARKQQLATLIHLCGAGAGNAWVRRGFRLRTGERCGDHEVRAYLDKVARMQAVFARLASQ